MGVWIETIGERINPNDPKSHPSWVCGLKPLPIVGMFLNCRVTPFVGVWIETAARGEDRLRQSRHTLRGCVD